MPSRSTPVANPNGYDEFVDRRVHHTRVAVKTADLSAGVVTLLIGLLALLLLSPRWRITGS